MFSIRHKSLLSSASDSKSQATMLGKPAKGVRFSGGRPEGRPYSTAIVGTCFCMSETPHDRSMTVESIPHRPSICRSTPSHTALASGEALSGTKPNLR